MDDGLLRSARELIAESFAMDAHFDLALDLNDRREQGKRRVYEELHDGPIRAGGWNCVVSSLFIHSFNLPEMALRKALDQISSLYGEHDESPELFSLCTTVGEVEDANLAGKTGVLISFEGVEPLGSDPLLLKIFHRLGVRAVGLAWSRRNYAADGCSFNPLKEGRKGGLTAFGVEVAEEAEALGMLIDISHLNDEGVEDVARFTKKPFIASHSNCRSLVPSMRNLTDEQTKLVASRGGVIGMNACSAFVSSDKRDDIGAEDLCRHIDHIVKLVGDEHVGLGLDFCDRLASYHVTPPSIESYDSLCGHEALPELVAVLMKNGYKDESIRRIIGLNFRRVYKEVIG
ncbi:MAG: dipeptidase [Synergistaceae bacterium]|jgi:membrane dipeptidase|nr:dipeptidase [Synergistaceae bacterium]